MSDTIEWSRYNNTLIERGKLDFWLPEDLHDVWYSKNGSDTRYSDRAIEVLSIIRFKFGLTLREVRGFAGSLFAMLKLDLEVPDYSTLCRRMGTLPLILWQELPEGPTHVVVDSTGLKVFGEGEWKVRIHGYSKRRTWRKLHLAVDESNNKILGAVLTTNDYKDNEVFQVLLEEVGSENIRQVTADGAYDDKKCFAWGSENNIKIVVPPKDGAKIAQHGNSNNEPLQRDEHIRQIRELGKRGWKKLVGYYRRSIAETAMYRFKILMGDTLRSRKFENQWAEVLIKINILNSMATPRTCS